MIFVFCSNSTSQDSSLTASDTTERTQMSFFEIISENKLPINLNSDSYGFAYALLVNFWVVLLFSLLSTVEKFNLYKKDKFCPILFSFLVGGLSIVQFFNFKYTASSQNNSEYIINPNQSDSGFYVAKCVMYTIFFSGFIVILNILSVGTSNIEKKLIKEINSTKNYEQFKCYDSPEVKDITDPEKKMIAAQNLMLNKEQIKDEELNELFEYATLIEKNKFKVKRIKKHSLEDYFPVFIHIFSLVFTIIPMFFLAEYMWIGYLFFIPGFYFCFTHRRIDGWNLFFLYTNLMQLTLFTTFYLMV